MKIINTKVLVHSGIFHADEVFAVALRIARATGWGLDLRNVSTGATKGTAVIEAGAPAFNCSITRTRDDKVISTFEGDIFDVGGIYEPGRALEQGLRLDHHQGLNITQQMGTDTIGFSSLGLLFKEIGVETIASFPDHGLDDAGISVVAERLKEILIYGVDGVDTGTMPPGDKHIYSMMQAISSFNPLNRDPEESNAKFAEATLWAYKILRNIVGYTIKETRERALTAKVMVEQEGSQVLILDTPMNWGYLPELDSEGNFLYVVFPTTEEDSEDKEWMVQCVPEAVGSFSSRKTLPGFIDGPAAEPVYHGWWGKRGGAIQELTGVEDAIFCHPNGFIGGAKSKEGALAMADLALAE